MSFNQSDKVNKVQPDGRDGEEHAPEASALVSAHASRLRLQQQPARIESDRLQQQSSGSGEFQPSRRSGRVQLGSSAGPSSRQQ